MSDSLDPTRTASFTMGPITGRRAVLLLHGFTGSPWELVPLGEALAAHGYFVHCPRLPGHGTTPEAMLWSGVSQWLQAADEAFLTLAHFEHVFVAGLSMGALLSLVLAERHGPRVEKLLLMAPVVRLKSRAARLMKASGAHGSALLEARWLLKKTTDIEDDEVREQAPLLRKYPLARLSDLFELQALAARAAAAVAVPTLIAAAVNDHVVDFVGIEALHHEIKTSRLLVLQRGFHIVPRDSDRARLISEAIAFFDDLTPSTMS